MKIWSGAALWIERSVQIGATTITNMPTQKVFDGGQSVHGMHGDAV